MIADMYADALRWYDRLQSANLDERFGRLRSIVSGGLNDLIRTVGEYGSTVVDSYMNAVKAAKPGTPQVVDLTLTLRTPESFMMEFNAEVERLRSLLGV